MSEKFRLDRIIGFRNTFYTKCINVIIDSIGPSIILRSIYISYVSIRWLKRYSVTGSCGFLSKTSCSRTEVRLKQVCSATETS